jgi:hypothetical protein
MTTTQPRRPALRAMYAGLALTVLVTIAPYVDRATGNVLADHLRAGYPDFSPARIDSAVTTWLVVLSFVGAVGVAGWIWTIHAVTAGKGWARWAATAMLVLGTSTWLTGLLVRDTSGDTGLPALLGWLGILPCVAGAVAVTMLWRGSAGALPGASG